MILEFTEHVTFSIVGLQESLPLGLRVDAFALGQWQKGVWVELATDPSVGSCRSLRFIRAAACPMISAVAIFAE